MDILDWSIALIIVIIITMVTIFSVRSLTGTLNGNPSITIQMQKTCGNDSDYKVMVFKNNELLEENDLPRANDLSRANDLLQTNNLLQTNELFTSTKSSVKPSVKPMYPDADTDFMPTSPVSVQYPDADNIVPMILKSNPVPVVQQTTSPEVKSMRSSCNQSLEDAQTTAYRAMVRNGSTSPLQESCASYASQGPSGLAYIGTNAVNVDPAMDPLTLYKTQQKFIPGHLEDSFVRGANIDDYETFAAVQDIGRIKLTNSGRLPVPSQSIDESSEVFAR